MSIVLRRQATQETGEQRLALAVITQALNDAEEISRRGVTVPQRIVPRARRSDRKPADNAAARERARKRADDLARFLACGCEPWASLIGLDPAFVVSIINHRSSGEPFGMIDKVRMRLQIEEKRAA